jgi:uncharacterized membrane protein YozB (DUF420 family)
MSSAMRSAHRLRLAAVLALGAFALHQLRYLIAFGSSSSAELAHQGHGYLAGALPILGVFALSALLATLVRGRHGAAISRASLMRRAATFALLLLAIYATQESMEGLLAAGHPGGAAALLANGGWIALPLAAVLGVLAAVLVRALEQVEVVISVRRAHRLLERPPRVRGSAQPTRAPQRSSTPLAFGLARRPPPPVPA